MAAQALLVADRLCCAFACKDYPLGPRKKIGVFLTYTGLDAEEMKHHVRLIADLPSIRRSVEAERTEVFTGCGSRDTCKNTTAYLARPVPSLAGSANDLERMCHHEQLHF